LTKIPSAESLRRPTTPVAITDNMPAANTSRASWRRAAKLQWGDRYLNTSAPARSMSSIQSMPLPAYLLDAAD
jgi:hypothetical protein